MCATKFAVVSGQSLKIYAVDENKNSYSHENCKINDGFNEDLKKNVNLFTQFAHGCEVNNNSRVEIVEGEYKRFGEPTEAAMKVLGKKMFSDNQKTCQSKY